MAIKKLLKTRRLVVIGVLMVGVTVGGRLLGYKFGTNTVVRCRRGHLFTTMWIPGVKVKSVDLGIARIQRCPVGQHWSLVLPVRDQNLTDDQRREAQEHRVLIA